MWFELMEVCATHILSPIVSYGLYRWRYVFVPFLWLSSSKFFTNKFQQTLNYVSLAFYLFLASKLCGYLMFVIRIVFMNFTVFECVLSGALSSSYSFSS